MVAFLVVSLKFDEEGRERTFESGSDVALPTQCVEDRSEEKDERHHENCQYHISYEPFRPRAGRLPRAEGTFILYSRNA
jgi:hypothetical protein